MLSYHLIRHLFSILTADSRDCCIRNKELAYSMRNTPVPTRDPLRWRLLPLPCAGL